MLGRRVDPGEGLVQQVEFGILGQGAGEKHALLLAAGELADLAFGEVCMPTRSRHARARARWRAPVKRNSPTSRYRPIITTSITRAGKSQSTEARWGT